MDFQSGAGGQQGNTLRTALQLNVSGVRLQGTGHRNGGRTSGEIASHGAVSAEAAPRGGVGILSTNAGYQPRSSQGDLAAHLADYTAHLGFPSYRFDMPGLGDSEGELPSEVLPFYEVVQEGGHVRYVAQLRDALIRDCGLKGMIYVGHCGSATTAVYTADQEPSPDLLGLILVEPSFIWYRAPGKAGPKKGDNWLRALSHRVGLLRQRIRAWLVQKPGGEKLTLLYAQLVAWCRRLVRKELPLDTNRRLLASYRRLFAKGIPILMLTAPPEKRRPDYFDYARYLHGGHPPRNFTLVEAPGASHSFLEGNGKKILFDAVGKWLQENFGERR